MSLKALANKVLHRDNVRDSKRDTLSHSSPTETTSVGQATEQVSPQIEQVTFEERAAIIEFDGQVPQEWAEGLARLCTMPCPGNIPGKRWRQTVDAAGVFADRWAVQASALGWTVFDIFGVDANAPEAAVHNAGLIWLLRDHRIVAISEDAVIVETNSGARQSFRPKPVSAAGRRVLLWELNK